MACYTSSVPLLLLLLITLTFAQQNNIPSPQSTATASPNSMQASSNNQVPITGTVSNAGAPQLQSGYLSPQQQQQQGYQPGGLGYQPQENYVPHSTYPYADSFPNPGAYDGYLVPAGPMMGYSNTGAPQAEYTGGSSLMPSAQNVMAIALRLFAKVGLFLLGGVALLFLGGLFTTAVCSLTPICTITFTGLQRGLDQEAMRALMTPEKIGAAANFVQDAIGKYQRLQRAINPSNY